MDKESIALKNMEAETARMAAELERQQALGMDDYIAFAVIASIVVFFLVAVWKIYTKADKPGWASLVPIYNLIVLMDIVGQPRWKVLLLMVPIANLIVFFSLPFWLAKTFGRGTGFALGLLFLPIVFGPILAFGSSPEESSFSTAVPV